MKPLLILIVCLTCFLPAVHAEDNPMNLEHHFADSNGVKIHYVKKGSGPLIVFIHGFPDFWYSWRHQIDGLSDTHTVVALDTRGYNKSDKPKGQENYSLEHLSGDIHAVIEHEKREKATIVGHDWGGAIAWHFAATHPEHTDKLIILNLPHPKLLARELTHNPDQQKNSAYARAFQKPNSHKLLTAEGLATMLSRGDADIKARYVEAFERSDFDSMMNYYRQNYPTVPYTDIDFPKLNVPVLQFHGLDDTALLPDGLNDTWNEITRDYTLVTLPGNGHWPHHDSPEMITETISWWLKMREE